MTDVVRILIVDDSAIVRAVLRELFERQPDMSVVGEAGDGVRALAAIEQLKPDVVTMDVLMPMMGGIDTIRKVMSKCPTPIVVVADARDNSRVPIEAIVAGAVEVFPKPRDMNDAEAAELVKVVRSAARIPLDRLRKAPTASPRPRRDIIAVGIAASTGGPGLLAELLAPLPKNFPCGIAIVQHTARGFTTHLADWLMTQISMRVEIGARGLSLEPGMVVIAPDDQHMLIERGGRVKLTNGPAERGHRPSGTVLLASMGEAYGARAAGIVLSGMGNDGAAGLARLAREGGLALVQDPTTAAVEGMPRAALTETPGAVTLSPAELTAWLLQIAMGSFMRGS